MSAEKKIFVPDNCTGYRHEVIPDDEPDCPYLERWLVGVGPSMFSRSSEKSPKAWFTIRLHHFFRSDEDHLHDHPFAFLTLVLRGSYEDWVECPQCMKGGLGPRPGFEYSCGRCRGTRQAIGTHMTPGTIRFRPALHRHRVVTDGCWTLVLSGPKVRDWGFWTEEGWVRQRAYFKRYGRRAACD